MLNEWIHTSRYVYNKTIGFIKNDSDKEFVYSFGNLRDKFVTRQTKKNHPKYIEKQNEIMELHKLKNDCKDKKEQSSISDKIKLMNQELRDIAKELSYQLNPEINDWELNTPKEIRAGCVKEIVSARKAAFSNLKNGNISS